MKNKIIKLLISAMASYIVFFLFTRDFNIFEYSNDVKICLIVMTVILFSIE